MREESVFLRFKSGSSDKAYNVELRLNDDGWHVDFAYGRYGSSLKSGSKTPKPVEYDKAKKIYDRLVLSKTSKGYSPQGEGIAFAGTEYAGRVSGFKPQLPNSVALEDFLDIVRENPGKWIGQQKFDGERRGIKVVNGEIIGSNRKGLVVPLRQTFIDAIGKLVDMGLKDFEIDCEDMGTSAAPFDILNCNGIDLRDRPVSERLDCLSSEFESMCKSAGIDNIFLKVINVKLDTPEQVSKLVRDCRGSKFEGLVFKHADAVYEPGRPNSGGTQLKLKFTNDITVRVSAHTEGKRSVAMEMLHDGGWTDVGNVTIPANRDIPAVNSLVDVNYLYAWPGGALYQPVFRGERFDCEISDCITDKLVYINTNKPESDIESVNELTPGMEP